MTAADRLVLPAPRTALRYDLLQRGLHWLMALVILTAIAIGLYCWFQPPGTPVRMALLEIHKSLGMTALVLVVFRLAWRLVKGAPPYREPIGRLNEFAAHGAHWALYALMLWMPLTGYMTSGAGNRSLPFFGLFHWPRLVPVDRELAHITEYLHGVGAYMISALLLLHFAAVAWHRLVRKDAILSRML